LKRRKWIKERGEGWIEVGYDDKYRRKIGSNTRVRRIKKDKTRAMRRKREVEIRKQVDKISMKIRSRLGLSSTV
jgi:hypothetical protein